MAEEETSRRGFFIAGLRGLAGGAIVAVSGYLAVKGLVVKGDSRANTCTGQSLCTNCSRLQTCVLPLGTSTRESQGK